MNIVLIGMPGAGKSSLGQMLAEALSAVFIDSDELIEQQYGGSLQAIVDGHGYQHLRELEAEVLQALRLENTVLATGGSAVYATAAMQALRAQAYTIYLSCPIDVLQRRIDNFSARGLAKPAGQSFAELYAEREPLYQSCADWELATGRHNEAELINQILQQLQLLS